MDENEVRRNPIIIVLIVLLVLALIGAGIAFAINSKRLKNELTKVSEYISQSGEEAADGEEAAEDAIADDGTEAGQKSASGNGQTSKGGASAAASKSNQKNSKKTTTTKKAQVSNAVKISYSGVSDGIYTYGAVDYVSDFKGIYSVDKNHKKTTLTSQKVTEKFTIINDRIYYTVIDSIKTVNGVKWAKCSAWVMQLNGSSKGKLFSYTGCGYVIYANSKDIFFADEAGEGVTNKQSYLYRYNVASKKKTLIYGDKTATGLTDFTYYSGYITYREAGEEQGTAAYSYDIYKNKNTQLMDEANAPLQTAYIGRNDRESVFIFTKTKHTTKDTEGNELTGYYNKLLKYSPTNGKMSVLKQFPTTVASRYYFLKTATSSPSSPFFVIEPAKPSGYTIYERYAGTTKKFATGKNNCFTCNDTVYSDGNTLILMETMGSGASRKYQIVSFSGGKSTVKKTLNEGQFASSASFGKNCAVLLDLYSQNSGAFKNPTSRSSATIINY